mgnify:CR=1 FL=1
MAVPTPEQVAELERLRERVSDAEELLAFERRNGGRCQCGDDEVCALLAERDRLRTAIEHVLRYGKVGKQSERRLRAALKGAPDD